MDNLELLNDKDRGFSFLKKAYFPKAIIHSKFDIYFRTVKEKKPFLILSPSAYKQNKKEIEEIGTEQDMFFVHGEPTEEMVHRCMIQIEKVACNMIIGIGGGSTIDLAKIVKKEKKLPLVAVPTTPGTGSEVTPYAVVTTETKEKKVISSQALVPDIVVLDSSLLRTLPNEILKYSITDMMSHCSEAILSRFATPLSDAFAVQALNEIFALKQTFSAAQSPEVSMRILMAGTFAGFAQGIAATGLAHAFAHYFGPRYNIPHGRAISIFLMEVLQLNLKNVSEEKIKATNMGKDEFLLKCKELLDTIGIGEEIIEIERNFDKTQAAAMIQRDICTMTNPFRPSMEQILAIINKKIRVQDEN